MPLDPATAQGWANVFGGGTSGAFLGLLTLWNSVQYMLARKERAELVAALERAQMAHVDTAKGMTSVVSEFTLTMERLRHKRAAPREPRLTP